MSQEQGPDGRPWPAPGAGAQWWRSDAADTTAAAPTVAPAEPAAQQELASGPFTDPPRATRNEGTPARPVRPTPAAVMTAPVRPVPPPLQIAPVPVPDPTPPAVESAGLNETPVVVPAAVPTQRLPNPRRPPRAPRRRRQPRPPWLGVPALVVLALAAAFFAWVSAEPFWLAVGHGHSGTATIVAGGSANACRATFTAEAGAFVASNVDLAGIDRSVCTQGATLAARMVSARAQRAYATDTEGLHLRWGIGLGLVMLCGLAIVWLTGAARFEGWQRATTVGLSLAAPVVVTLAMLAAAH